MMKHRVMMVIDNGKNWLECFTCGQLATEGNVSIPFLRKLKGAHEARERKWLERAIVEFPNV